jgi:hypothetical protein
MLNLNVQGKVNDLRYPLIQQRDLENRHDLFPKSLPVWMAIFQLLHLEDLSDYWTEHHHIIVVNSERKRIDIITCSCARNIHHQLHFSFLQIHRRLNNDNKTGNPKQIIATPRSRQNPPNARHPSHNERQESRGCRQTNPRWRTCRTQSCLSQSRITRSLL